MVASISRSGPEPLLLSGPTARAKRSRHLELEAVGQLVGVVHQEAHMVLVVALHQRIAPEVVHVQVRPLGLVREGHELRTWQLN